MERGDNISYVACSHHQTYLQDMQRRPVGLCCPSLLALLQKESAQTKIAFLHVLEVLLYLTCCKLFPRGVSTGHCQHSVFNVMLSYPCSSHGLVSLYQTQHKCWLLCSCVLTLPDCHHLGKGQSVFQNWGDMHHGQQTTSGGGEICSRDDLSILKMD